MKLLWHVMFWLIYGLFEAYLSSLISGGFSVMSHDVYLTMLGVTFITLPVRLVFAYALLLYVIPRFFSFKKSIWQGVGILSLLFLLFLFLFRICINYVAWPVIFKYFPGFDIFDMGLTSLSVTRVIAPVALIVGSQLLIDRYYHEKQIDRLKQAKLEAELQYLRTQLQPHFLFNTLNNIYSLANIQSNKTAPAVAGLSKLMRYILYESAKGQTTLSAEIQMIQEYINLENLRYLDNLMVRFEENVENPSQNICPLLLLPFVENAFKHGASESTKPIDILCSVTEQGGELTFVVENSINGEDTSESLGTGLDNVRRRLVISYPDKHDLHINKGSGKFSIKLNIDLT